MMIRRFSAVLVMCFTMNLSGYDLTGYFQNWTAVRAVDDHEILLSRNRFRMDMIKSSASGRAYSSIDFTSHGMGTGDDFEMTIRELYLDVYIRNWDIRIGKQQVVWGKADGVFVNDIVNPLDLRFFLLQDFEDIRMGSPMIRANGYFGSSKLELLWIPVFEPWKFAPPGTPWSFPEVSASTINDLTVNMIREDHELPDRRLKNSEWGLKFSTFLLGTDLSLLYFDGFQDRPSVYVKSFEQTDTVLTLNLIPTFDRSPMVGINFSKPLAGILIRGEGAYFRDARFNRQALPGVFVEKTVSDFVQGVLGIDLTGPFGSSLSFQYLKREILDYSPTIIGSSESETWITGMFTGSFWNENAAIRFLALYDRENESGLVQADASYNINDALNAGVGLVGIWGGESLSSSQFNFGVFRNNDMVYLKLTYSY